LITPIARLTGLVGDTPVVIVGFDATHCLCVLEDGHLEYIEHRDVSVQFWEDLAARVWLIEGGNSGETDTESADGVQPEGAQDDADALSRSDGRGDDDVAESPA
jgi:hypothetical protein